MPIPPNLVKVLAAHIEDHGVSADERLFRRRQACASLMLNAGVPATEAARRLGHSVAMLLKRYANCVEGQEQVANERISAALEHSGI